jgi:hypothetical protein
MASCITKDATSEILYASRVTTAVPAGPDEARPSTALSDDMATFSKEAKRLCASPNLISITVPKDSGLNSGSVL